MESGSPPDPMPLVDAALADAAGLRDHLLDRAGAPPGPPGERLARLAATVLIAVPSPDGEPRLERWKKIKERGESQAPSFTLRDFAAFHATMVHSVVTLTELMLARVLAFNTRSFAAWRPDAVPVSGLVYEARTVIARHCVQRAALDQTDEALRLLSHARAIAPREGTFADIHAEARFRAGRWDEALLDDLARMTKDAPTLATCAEYLRVAVQLARRRDVEIASRRLRQLIGGTPHAWMAQVRMGFARPSLLSDARHVERLVGSKAADRADGADPRERVVFALYGEDPRAAVAELRRDLGLQRDALAQAAQLRQERIEEILTRPPPPRRPDVPRHPGDGAVAHALEALRIRLDRPWTAKHALKADLEAHAGRAGQLDGHDGAPVGAWLDALGDEVGLVPLLDRAIQGDAGADALLGDALSSADRELDGAVESLWLADAYARTTGVWPLLAGLPGDVTELRAQARAVETALAAAAAAKDRGAREAADRALSTLLEAVQAAQERRGSFTADDRSPSGDVEDDDAFAPMRVPPLAIERSRDELGTPDWAIGKGLGEVLRFNMARGNRDLKMLHGSRDETGGLWELRVRDGRLPVRVMYVLADEGPRVVAILAKQDDAHQRRLIERVKGWLVGGEPGD